MSVHIEDVKHMASEAVVSFDICQGTTRKQTVTISVVRDPGVQVLVDGKRVETD